MAQSPNGQSGRPGRGVLGRDGIAPQIDDDRQSPAGGIVQLLHDERPVAGGHRPVHQPGRAAGDVLANASDHVESRADARISARAARGRRRQAGRFGGDGPYLDGVVQLNAAAAPPPHQPERSCAAHLERDLAHDAAPLGDDVVSAQLGPHGGTRLLGIIGLEERRAWEIISQLGAGAVADVAQATGLSRDATERMRVFSWLGDLGRQWSFSTISLYGELLVAYLGAIAVAVLSKRVGPRRR